MKLIYNWHIDFDGSNGYVVAENSTEAREKVLDKYEFGEFKLKHLQIKYLYNLDYLMELHTELSEKDIVSRNSSKLKEK